MSAGYEQQSEKVARYARLWGIRYVDVLRLEEITGKVQRPPIQWLRRLKATMRKGIRKLSGG